MSRITQDTIGRRSGVLASPYDAYRDSRAAFVSEMAMSRISAAREGIAAIVSILQERELGLSMPETEGDLVLDSITVHGLLEGIACLADFAQLHATGGESIDTIPLPCDSTDHRSVEQAARAAAKRNPTPKN